MGLVHPRDGLDSAAGPVTVREASDPFIFDSIDSISFVCPVPFVRPMDAPVQQQCSSSAVVQQCRGAAVSL